MFLLDSRDAWENGGMQNADLPPFSPDEHEQGIFEVETRLGPRFERPRFDPLRSFGNRSMGWLWPGRIPFGRLTLLAASEPRIASFVALDLAARLSRAAAWPGEAESQNNASHENLPADKLRPAVNSRINTERFPPVKARFIRFTADDFFQRMANFVGRLENQISSVRQGLAPYLPKPLPEPAPAVAAVADG